MEGFQVSLWFQFANAEWVRADKVILALSFGHFAFANAKMNSLSILEEPQNYTRFLYYLLLIYE